MGCCAMVAVLLGGWVLLVIPGGIYRWLQFMLADRTKRRYLLATALGMVLLVALAAYPGVLLAVLGRFIDVSDSSFLHSYSRYLSTVDGVLAVCGAVVLLLRPDWAWRPLRAFGVTAMTLIYGFWYQIEMVVGALRAPAPLQETAS